MASRYVFSEEQIQELAKAAKENKKKDVDKRLRALMMRASGKKLAEIASATGYSFSGIVKCGHPFYSARYFLESAGFSRLVQINELVREQMRISTTKQAHLEMGQTVALQWFALS